MPQTLLFSLLRKPAFFILPLKIVHPVRLEVIHDERNGAKEPCKRICPEDDANIRHIVYSDCDIGDADCAPAYQHYKHRHLGLSGAAEYACHAVRQRQKAVEPCLYPRLLHAIRYNGGIIIEQRDELRSKRHERKTDEFGKQHAGYHSEHGTLFDPVILPRAKILACKGRQRN